ncbi:hypothetical protein QTP70_016591 [Hemibagrus guttatus]|uniref:Tyr recombinase domain-containing protein n=1 Tax=Hemibagrus guttatus TaxID=175788 RepID=A0AAE0VB31_9TELE|nr:hypothetical protein QTP70_016591 [Hemibagrus guttatus]
MCIEFAPGMSMATLHPRVEYIPKVPNMAGRLVILLAFCPLPHESAEQETALALPKEGQSGLQSGLHWVVEAIIQAYEACSIALPLGVRAHSTRGIASSSALARGVPLQEISAVAGWSSLHTFIRFYNLDLAPRVPGPSGLIDLLFLVCSCSFMIPRTNSNQCMVLWVY